jgi:hypothetical protein
MINLAPFKYKELIDRGDIIDQIKTHFDGSNYESYVSLKERYRSYEHTGFIGYNSALDGSGRSACKEISIYIAISEALERWAHSSLKKAQTKEYGFDLDASTNGFAAYPELFCFYSKQASRREAIERYTLKKFWEGKAPAYRTKTGEINCYQLSNPWNIPVVIVHRLIDRMHVYGFGASSSLQNAYEHALSELSNNQVALGRMKTSELKPTQLIEKRLWYFGSQVGYECFEQKVRESISTSVFCMPAVHYKGEVKGPWSRYAKVYRHCFLDTPWLDLKTQDEKIFLF